MLSRVAKDHKSSVRLESASESAPAMRVVSAPPSSAAFGHYELHGRGMCICLEDGSSPERMWMQGAVEKTPKPVDMFNRTKLPEGEPDAETNVSQEPVMPDVQTEEDKRRHEAAIKEAGKHWRKLAAEKNWDAVIPSL